MMCNCCLKERQYDLRFLRFCKRATLQFCFLKPPMAVATIILAAKDLYTEGDWSPTKGKICEKNREISIKGIPSTGALIRARKLFLLKWTGQNRTGTFLVFFKDGSGFLLIFKSILELKLIL